MAAMDTEVYRRRILPVGLLLQGRRCLVVGSGEVARRRVEQAMSAGAEVCVVGTGWQEGDAGRFLGRDFSAGFCDGMRVVFALDEDPSVNREVAAACHQRGILCALADKGWVQGDLVMPAILQEGDVTVAISTGGRSCRRTRLVKELLARQFSLAGDARFLVVGTSHRELPLERRVDYHLDAARTAEAGSLLRRVMGLHEFVLLSTCNRVECLAIAVADAAVPGLIRRVLDLDHLAEGESYVHTGYEAFGHLARLDAGLLAQACGEEHITAQLKEAVELAIGQGWAGALTRRWHEVARRGAKEIRRRQGRGLDVEDLAVDRLPAEGPVAVLGTGMVGTGMVHALRRRWPGRRIHWGFHRNAPTRVPASVEIAPLAQVKRHLAACTAVVVATSGQVLGEGEISLFASAWRTVVVDLSVPRAVAPALDGCAALEVIDLDGLKTAPPVGDPEHLQPVLDRLRPDHDRILAGFRTT